MGITDNILSYQLAHGVFENARIPGTEGIARFAIDRGFEKLSVKQQAILKPYLSQRCSGVTDPGGHHNGCSVNLEGEALLGAYHRCDDTESLMCDSCEDEAGLYIHQWEKLSKE